MFMDEERIRLQKEQQKYQLERMTAGFAMLQRQFKIRVAQKRLKDAREQRQRENVVLNEIVDRQAAYKRERRIFEQQLTAYYDQMQRETKKRHEILQVSRKHSVQVRSLWRRQDNERRRQEENEKKERNATDNERRRQQVIAEWMERAEERSETFKHHCMNCLEMPDSGLERNLRKQIKNRIKQR